MKKIIIMSIMFCIAPILVLGLIVTGWLLREKDEYRTVSFDENVMVSSTLADMNPYDFEEMIAESSLIAYGTVSNIVSYMSENAFVASKFDFEISSIEKGNLNVNDVITVRTLGGRVTYGEFLEAELKALDQYSPEYLEQQIAMHGIEYVEMVHAGVPNLQEGEQLLLFLSETIENTEEADYYISGGSYYGKYSFDNKKDEYFNEKMEEFTDTEKPIKVKRDKKVKQKNFKDKVKKTKDRSKQKLEEDRKIMEDIEQGNR